MAGLLILMSLFVLIFMLFIALTADWLAMIFLIFRYVTQIKLTAIVDIHTHRRSVAVRC